MIAALLAACGSAAQPAPRGNGCVNLDDRPFGSAADYTPPVIAGFKISAPVTCEHGAYIRIERAAGARRLGTARSEAGGFDEGCREAPATDGDCPVLNYTVPLMAAVAAIRARGLDVNGIGGGPCADLAGDYSTWNISVGVTSWTNVATAVTLVAAELDRYDVAGYVGVAVHGESCAVVQ